jgi:hypothetical protein
MARSSSLLTPPKEHDPSSWDDSGNAWEAAHGLAPEALRRGTHDEPAAFPNVVLEANPRPPSFAGPCG